MKRKMSLTALGAFMFLALDAQQVLAADEGKFYIGLEAGATGVSGDGPAANSIFVPGQTFEDSDTTFGLHAGFQFTNWFAAELGYSDFGSASEHFRIKPDIIFIVAPNDTQTIDAKGVSLTGVFSHHFTDALALSGVLGVASVEYRSTWSGGFSEVTGNLQERHNFSDQGLVYGIAASYALSDSVGVRADVRRTDVGDFTLDTASIGFEYSF